jgi:hypothetical protein
MTALMIAAAYRVPGWLLLAFVLAVFVFWAVIWGILLQAKSDLAEATSILESLDHPFGLAYNLHPPSRNLYGDYVGHVRSVEIWREMFRAPDDPIVSPGVEHHCGMMFDRLRIIAGAPRRGDDRLWPEGWR